jgi:hypothetical protein
MLTTLTRHIRRTIADRRNPLPRSAAADPPAASSFRPARVGSTIAAVQPDLSGEDRVHGGSHDLEAWPPSLAEQRIAADYLTTGDPAPLYAVTGSEERAVAIVLAVRDTAKREADAKALLDRLFGPTPVGGAS